MTYSGHSDREETEVMKSFKRGTNGRWRCNPAEIVELNRDLRDAPQQLIGAAIEQANFGSLNVNLYKVNSSPSQYF
jgi:hypothetical protein